MILKQNLIFFIVLMLIPFRAFSETATTSVYLPETEVKSGMHFHVPVKIDPADSLAGIKLVLEYDPNLFKFEKVEKTKVSAGLMHVVNDQKPGRLIIVMAGAKGISGKDIALCEIHFNVLPGVSEKHISKFAITEIELMTDTLKEIPCTLSTTRISILPSE